MKFLKLNELKVDSLYYFIARLFPAIASLLAIAIYVRILGQSIYGNYALLQAAILFAGNVAPIWLSQSILRFYSRFHSPYARQTFNAAIVRAVICTLVIFVGLFFVLSHTLLTLRFTDLLLGGLAVSALTIYAILSSIQQALLNPRNIIYAESCRAGVMLGLPLLLLAIFQTKNYSFVLIGNLCAYVAAAIISSHKLPMRLKESALHGNATRIIKKVMLPFGFPIATWLGLSILLNTSDRYIIKYFMDSQAVGVYSAVYDVVYNGFGLVLAPILYAAHPRIARLWNEGREKESMHLVRNAIFLQSGIAFIALLVLSLLSPWLVKIILGTANATATQLVVPVALGAVLWQLAMLVHKYLEMRRKTLPMIIYVFCALIVNLIGNIVLVPRFGYVAAAYTTAISAFLYMSMVLLDINWRYHWSKQQKGILSSQKLKKVSLA